MIAVATPKCTQRIQPLIGIQLWSLCIFHMVLGAHHDHSCKTRNICVQVGDRKNNLRRLIYSNV